MVTGTVYFPEVFTNERKPVKEKITYKAHSEVISIFELHIIIKHKYKPATLISEKDKVK